MFNYTPVTRKEMEEALQGFSLVPLSNTVELVYGRRVKGHSVPLTLRVYSSIEPEGTSRGAGQDAIRIALVAKVEGKITGVGRSKRINRVPGWERRLKERLEAWEKLLGPDCPRCGSPTKIRRGKSGEFFGCSRYPDCRGTTPVTDSA